MVGTDVAEDDFDAFIHSEDFISYVTFFNFQELCCILFAESVFTFRIILTKNNSFLNNIVWSL
jgi:hypothetical protein